MKEYLNPLYIFQVVIGLVSLAIVSSAFILFLSDVMAWICKRIKARKEKEDE